MGRVEDGRGSRANWRCPVSHPRSSNRTCGSPASGFPTGFMVRPTAVIQRQNADPPEDQVTGESLRSATGHLVPPTEEVANTFADVMINGFVCPAPCSI